MQLSFKMVWPLLNTADYIYCSHTRSSFKGTKPRGPPCGIITLTYVRVLEPEVSPRQGLAVHPWVHL